jgi:hypothetical protein
MCDSTPWNGIIPAISRWKQGDRALIHAKPVEMCHPSAPSRRQEPKHRKPQHHFDFIDKTVLMAA